MVHDFFIASHIVMALPTIATTIYSCLSLKLLKALAKSNGNLFAIAIVGRKITLEIAIKKRSNERRLRAITLLEAILLSQYWKN